MLKGIDVSSHNGFPFNPVTQDAYNESDFCIVKATQGTGYVYSQFQAVMNRAKNDGKLLGMYHYASNGDARAEAQHFWNVVASWNKQAIPVLDFEEYQNSKNWDDTLWAKRFCEKYHELSGVWPLIYVSASSISRVSVCAQTCGLWVAGYPTSKEVGWNYPKFSYAVAPWATWTIWQYTSAGGVDRNIAQLTAESWQKVAAAGGSVVNVSAKNGQLARLARDVINGKYGNGVQRKDKLGPLYPEVQELVNAILGDTSDHLADMVIAGRLGDGEDRKYALGSRYDLVQKIVNSRLR